MWTPDPNLTRCAWDRTAHGCPYKQQVYSLTHLCDAERDVTHIEPPSLAGHLAAYDRHRGGSHGQSVWSHSRQQCCGRDLTSS